MTERAQPSKMIIRSMCQANIGRFFVRRGNAWRITETSIDIARRLISFMKEQKRGCLLFCTRGRHGGNEFKGQIARLFEELEDALGDRALYDREKYQVVKTAQNGIAFRTVEYGKLFSKPKKKQYRVAQDEESKVETHATDKGNNDRRGTSVLEVDEVLTDWLDVGAQFDYCPELSFYA